MVQCPPMVTDIDVNIIDNPIVGSAFVSKKFHKRGIVSRILCHQRIGYDIALYIRFVCHLLPLFLVYVGLRVPIVGVFDFGDGVRRGQYRRIPDHSGCHRLFLHLLCRT